MIFKIRGKPFLQARKPRHVNYDGEKELKQRVYIERKKNGKYGIK
jgi:hypothetical protein